MQAVMETLNWASLLPSGKFAKDTATSRRSLICRNAAWRRGLVGAKFIESSTLLSVSAVEIKSYITTPLLLMYEKDHPLYPRRALEGQRILRPGTSWVVQNLHSSVESESCSYGAVNRAQLHYAGAL